MQLVSTLLMMKSMLDWRLGNKKRKSKGINNMIESEKDNIYKAISKKCRKVAIS